LPVSVALLDANVLYPAPLRDFLLRLATARLFTPQWSHEIQDEWTRNVLANRDDLTAEQINRTRNLMDKAFPNARVMGYDSLIPTLTNDAKDRHVLAAAITGGAAQIVTFNIKDFPEASKTSPRRLYRRMEYKPFAPIVLP
jgi:predicted nucleic acid-binding protein